MNMSTISETKNNLSALLDRVRAGESITILDRDRPIARLVPVRDADDAHLTELARRGLVRCGTGADLSTIVAVAGPTPRGGDVLAALLAERDEGP
jgi:prevent-host-death family protein